MEKIKPIKSKSSILSLKFQRKSDYTKFLKFIQVETKKLKGIAEPKENKLKDILKVGGVGLLGLGLFNLVGKGKDAINKTKGQGDFQIPFAIGRARDKDIKSKGSFNMKPFGEQLTGQSQKIKIKTPIKTSVTKKVSKPVQTTVRSPITKKTAAIRSRAKVTPSGSPINIEQDQFANRKRMGDPPNNVSSNPQKRAFDYFKRTGRIEVLKRDVEFVDGKPFMNRKITNTIKPVLELEFDQFLDPKTNKLIDFYALPDFETQKLLNQRTVRRLRKQMLERTFKAIDQVPEGEVEAATKLVSEITSKPNIFKRLFKKLMNFYNEGRNVRFPDENKARFGTPLEYFKENPDPTTLFGDDSLQKTRSDEAFKTGKKGIRTLRPLKAFTLKMLKTGPTPLFRQVIERPFRSLFRTGASGLKFLKNNPLVNALLKSRVVKGGLFVIDAIFAGQEFYDLFLRPGDNVFTSLYDLYVSINNAYFQNDPEKLKYFITESKGSHSSLFGRSFTNEQIRKKEIERNLKIKRLKEAAAGGEGGGNNIIVVPQNQQSNNVSGGGNEMPRQTGRDDISFVPFEPLNIGDDILLHKLNQ